MLKKVLFFFLIRNDLRILSEMIVFFNLVLERVFGKVLLSKWFCDILKDVLGICIFWCLKFFKMEIVFLNKIVLILLRSDI